MSKTPRGVRQINENVLQEGRALILTNEDLNQVDWDHIPDGTLHVDKETGYISVKLKGQKSWTPAGIRTVDANAASDVTLVLSRDSEFIDESFTVICADNGNGTFTYENDNGERRTKPFIKDKGYVFDLDKGTYIVGRNHLTVTIDGVLTRTVPNKGVEELTEKRFILCDTLEDGQEVSVRYIEWLRVGNPWPRIFLNEEEPDTAGKGDFWLKDNATWNETDAVGEDWENYDKISWNKISDIPERLQKYVLEEREEFSKIGHRHSKFDIDNFPETLPASGGDCESVKGKVLVTNTDPNISEDKKVIVVLEGKPDSGRGVINENYIPNINVEKLYGTISQENLPSISTNLLEGTINLTNLPNIPTTMLSGKILKESLPSIPVTLLSGLISTNNIGKIPASKINGVIPKHNLPETPEIFVQNTKPEEPTEGCVWFCTDISLGLHIEVFKNNTWLSF